MNPTPSNQQHDAQSLKEVPMNKKRWILVGVIIVLAVGGLCLVSYAGRHFPDRMGLGPIYRLNLLSEELGLTDDQRAALKNLFKEHRKDIQPLAEMVMARKRALMDRVLAENPDPAAIRNASADLGNAIADAAVGASSLARHAQAILTPDQWKRFQNMRQSRQRAFDAALREWREKGSMF
jgi:Spy/CpxP family protein refolding chaperone